MRCDDMALIHPMVYGAFDRLRRDLDSMFVLGRTEYRFEVFETYRSPQRQQELFVMGSTKAVPFKSAHQFGLAVDFVPKVDGKWSWEVPSQSWADLRAAALRVGMDAPISWDRAHVEHPLFNKVRQTMGF